MNPKPKGWSTIQIKISIGLLYVLFGTIVVAGLTLALQEDGEPGPVRLNWWINEVLV